MYGKVLKKRIRIVEIYNALYNISFTEIWIKVKKNKKIIMVPGARLELARPKRPRDFKSLVSTDFTTRAQN